MKIINEAYRWALEHPGMPAATQPLCAAHYRAASALCRRCDKPICPLCPGFSRSLCVPHYQQMVVRQSRQRVLKEWGLLIAIIMGLRAVGLSGVLAAGVVGAYLAWLGLRFLVRRRWFGCLALLLLPYSLILAGVWSLFDSLKGWNEPTTRT